MADLPVLNWNFNGTLIDTVESVEFNNQFGIEITSEYVNINQSGGNYYLEADVPVALLSKFSKTLMFRFKCLPDFHGTVNFSFSTDAGTGSSQAGFWTRILGSRVDAEFYGTPNTDGSTNILHSINHEITGGLPIIFDDWCHLCIVLDHTNNFVTTYINGSENVTTNALVGGSTQAETDAGTYYGSGSTMPFFINRWFTFGDGNAL